MAGTPILTILLVCLSMSALAADPPATRPSVRFTTVDLYVDSADKPLAAWQVELKATQGAVKIVGVEGGDHREIYRDPPYYDAAALAGGRIILASFTTNDAPPKGRIRVARVHLQVEGNYQLAAILSAAADPAGTAIHAKASASENEPKNKE